MKVILRDDVSGLGSKGDVCDVADGYFRNYLNPNRLAFKATAGNQDQAEAMRRASALRHAASRADAEEVATSVVSSTITIAAKAGEGGRLFGSVTASDIAEAVTEQTGAVIDRHAIQFDGHIKDLGQTIVSCKLHPEVEFPITVEVVEA